MVRILVSSILASAAHGDQPTALALRLQKGPRWNGVVENTNAGVPNRTKDSLNQTIVKLVFKRRGRAKVDRAHSRVPPGDTNLPHWCRRKVRRFLWGHSRVPPGDTNLPHWCRRRVRRFRWGHGRVPPGDTNLPHWCRCRVRRFRWGRGRVSACDTKLPHSCPRRLRRKYVQVIELASLVPPQAAPVLMGAQLRLSRRHELASLVPPQVAPVVGHLPQPAVPPIQVRAQVVAQKPQPALPASISGRRL